MTAKWSKVGEQGRKREGRRSTGTGAGPEVEAHPRAPCG